MIAGTWNFGAGSIINGKPIEDMTDAEKQAFINQMSAKGRRVIIERFNDGGSKEKKDSAGGNMIVNNNTIVQKKDEPDYWTRLEHQYAGMAMQGMLNNSYLAGEFRKDPNNGIEDMSKIITKAAAVYAHALVEKMKEERK